MQLYDNVTEKMWRIIRMVLGGGKTRFIKYVQ